MISPPVAAGVFVELVVCGWIVVLYVRARKAWPERPPPLSTLHAVTGTINLAVIAVIAMYAATP